MDKVKIHAQICSELTELYERKNHDYGDSFGKSYTEYGMTMACIRLEDKLNRLKSLNRKTSAVLDESIEDTLMDLANYAIMTLIERQVQSGKATPDVVVDVDRGVNCFTCDQRDKSYVEYPCNKCFRGKEGETVDMWEATV